MKYKNTILSIALLASSVSFAQVEIKTGSFSPDDFITSDIESNQDYDISPKIISGWDTNISNFPFYARIMLIRNNNDGTFNYGQICGGSIINDSFILTAAHCVVEEEIASYKDAGYDLKVLVNDGDADVSYYDTRLVNQVYYHANYETESHTNDIAILKIEDQILESYTAIDLPTKEDVEYYENLSVYSVAGMGLVEDESTCVSNCTPETLQTAKMNRENDAFCGLILYGIDYPEDSAICVTPINDGNVCNGDSGGPLTYTDIYGKQQQIGITSYGSTSCENPVIPSVFTEIAFYNDWIESITSLEYHEKAVAYDPSLGSQNDNDNSDNGSDDDSGSFGYFTFIVLGLLGFRRRN